MTRMQGKHNSDATVSTLHVTWQIHSQSLDSQD